MPASTVVEPAACVTPLMAYCVTLTGPSTLVVPIRTEPVRGESSLTATSSSPSTTPSATGVTLSVKVADWASTPSVIEYVATGTGPL